MRCIGCGVQEVGGLINHLPRCDQVGSAKKRKRAIQNVDNDLGGGGGNKRPRSARIQQNAEREMGSLLNAAYGHDRPSMIVGDITPSLYRPLDQGRDGRYYTSTTARREIERTIAATAKTYKNEGELPPLAKEMLKRSKSSKKNVIRMSSRSSNTGYRTGSDVTYTQVTGADFSGTRSASDTPRPRSPEPRATGEELPIPNLRYEQTHQSTYSFTGLPGSTVYAPTQANQVADTNLERFASRSPDGFIVREDTYERSSLTAYRPIDGGGYESRSASYMRRQLKPEEE